MLKKNSSFKQTSLEEKGQEEKTYLSIEKLWGKESETFSPELKKIITTALRKVREQNLLQGESN